MREHDFYSDTWSVASVTKTSASQRRAARSACKSAMRLKPFP